MGFRIGQTMQWGRNDKGVGRVAKDYTSLIAWNEWQLSEGRGGEGGCGELYIIGIS